MAGERRPDQARGGEATHPRPTRQELDEATHGRQNRGQAPRANIGLGATRSHDKPPDHTNTPDATPNPAAGRKLSRQRTRQALDGGQEARPTTWTRQEQRQQLDA